MTPADIQRLADGLSKAVKAALLACRASPLGSVCPRDDVDAMILSRAGLSWTDAHWWRQLNEAGLAVRALLQERDHGRG